MNHMKTLQSYRKYQATRRETRRAEFQELATALGGGSDIDGRQALIDIALEEGRPLSLFLYERLTAEGYEVPECIRPVVEV